MNCVNCGAPMHLVRDRDYWVCDYCPTFHFPSASRDGVRVLGELSALDCPVCTTGLVTAAIEGRRVWTCRNCEGVLAGQQVFAVVVQTLRALRRGEPLPPHPISPDELNRHLDCPGCRRVMAVHPYYGPGNVVLDSCGDCGLIWADRGEVAILGAS